MMETDADQQQRSTSGSSGKSRGASTRVDAAHAIGENTATEAATPTASPPVQQALVVSEPEVVTEPPVLESAMRLVQQVRSQAGELATHLRRQQSELDHRESDFNARHAAMENEVRSARLWLNERQQELGERTADLERREREFEEQLKQSFLESESVEKSRTTQRDALAEREVHLTALAEQLNAQQAELNASSAQLAQRIAKGERAEELERQVQYARKQVAEMQAEVDRCTARQENLDAAEELVATQMQEIEAERRELALERESLAEQSAAECQELVRRQRADEAELDKQRASLKRRTQELDARSTALKQLRADVQRAQRETLEMRLATEELWSRLCGTMAPAALTRSLGQIRAQLSEQQRLELAELAQQKSELEQLALRVGDSHDKLAHQRQELQLWTEKRQAEIEEQASRLVAREQELDAQETRFGQLEKEWQAERFGFQQEIRRLLRQMRRDSVAA